MTDKRLLIISITIVIVAIIFLIFFTSALPNDLQCGAGIAAESGKEMILTDCYNPHISRGDTTYTVKVTFKE